MDLQTGVANFQRAMTHCDNIITVHQKHGGGAKGRRYLEPSLDRAVVVLAVAAWQAAVQDIATGILDTASPVGVPAIEVARYEANVGHARKAIGDFATPNAEKTRALLVACGYDPFRLWSWETHEGLPRGGRKTLRPHEVGARLNEWLKVRHAIAHGHAALPAVNALESVRSDGATDDPTIRLADVQQCVRFMRLLFAASANGAAAHLGISITI